MSPSGTSTAAIPEAVTGDEGASGSDRGVALSALVIAFYASLGVLAYLPLVPGSSARVYGTSDPAQTAWFFGWTAHALLSGHSPFFATAMNAPFGFNVTEVPAVPLLALLTLPITVLAGPIASANLCIVAAMPVSAASAYLVFRHWRVWSPAAALGGLLYGFSPYMVIQGASHLHLVFNPIPPLIVAVLVDLLRGSRHPLRQGLALGGLITAQFFVSSEVLALTAVICAIGVVAFLGRRLRGGGLAVISEFVVIARSLSLACLSAAILLAYPLWYQFAGPDHYTGPPWPISNRWHADLAGLVAPSPWQAVAPALRSTGAAISANAGAEDGVYLGLLMIAAALLLTWAARRSPRVRLAAALALASMILSLGRRLYVSGFRHDIPLPFAALTHVPGLVDVLPIRFGFTTAACLAALVAFALDHLRTLHGEADVAPHAQTAGRRTNTVFLVTGAVLIINWLPSWPYPTAPARVPPRTISAAIPGRDPIVLTYPYTISPEGSPLLWQAADRYAYRILGMYGIVPDRVGHATVVPPLLDPPSVQEYLVGLQFSPGAFYPRPPSVSQVERDLPEFLARQRVGAVLVDSTAPGGEEAVALFSRVLGHPAASKDGFVVWNYGVHQQTTSGATHRMLLRQ